MSYTLDAAALRSFRHLATAMMEINPDMSMRSFALLASVLEEPGKPMSAYARALDMPIQTASRLLLDLSDKTRAGMLNLMAMRS